ncbi:hypothetical protein Aduo_009581 [Ancylostoma duodenale]
MFMATPRDYERFCLRLLLLHRKNMHSFEHLRTVDSVLHQKFSDTAREFVLLHDDAHYEHCLEEAAHFRMPAELRALFTYMLAFCGIASLPVHSLFSTASKAAMDEDLMHRGFTESDAELLAYYDLHDRLSVLHTTSPQGSPHHRSLVQKTQPLEWTMNGTHERGQSYTSSLIRTNAPQQTASSLRSIPSIARRTTLMNRVEVIKHSSTTQSITF